MRMTESQLIVSTMLLLTGAALSCASASAGGVVQGTRNEGTSSPLGGFPATFEGELPCADCPGIFYHLDLFEDGVFFLRTTYLGRGAGAISDRSDSSFKISPEPTSWPAVISWVIRWPKTPILPMVISFFLMRL